MRLFARAPDARAARSRAAWLAAGLLAASLPLAAQTPIHPDDFESGNTFAWDFSLGETSLVPPLAFRVEDLDLRDPHLFVDVPIAGCSDFTDAPLPFGLGPSFNARIATAIATDGDGDGFLDLSILLLFRPFDQAAAGLRLDTARGSCPPPASATSCGLDLSVLPQTSGYSSFEAGVCLETVPDTTSGYSPVIVEPGPPCFTSENRARLPLELEGIVLPLRDVQAGAALLGDPVTGLGEGLLRGFLTEADANATLLPADLPLIGGEPISILLPGGAGSCAPGDDRDMHLGAAGWWFYFNDTASEVPYSGI